MTGPDEGKLPRKPKKSLGLSTRLPSIQVTPDMFRELETESRRQGISVAAAVRTAIRAWLDAQKKES